MTQPVVLLDANVFPTTWLLDILLTLDEHEIVDVVWSERILDEVRRAMVERQHRDPDRIDCFLASIRSMNPTHCVYGWEPRETLLDELPDPDDRHVLAAALVADADYIVTYNLKDFPWKSSVGIRSQPSIPTFSCAACWIGTHVACWM